VHLQMKTALLWIRLELADEGRNVAAAAAWSNKRTAQLPTRCIQNLEEGGEVVVGIRDRVADEDGGAAAAQQLKQPEWIHRPAV